MNTLTKIVEEAVDVPLMDIKNISKIILDYGKPDCDYGCINDDDCMCYGGTEDGEPLFCNKSFYCYTLAYKNEGIDYGYTHIYEPISQLNLPDNIKDIIYDYTYDTKDEEDYVEKLTYEKYWNTWYM